MVELLLTIALLAGLMAAAVFGFSSLQRNAQLNEGVERVETAMRFARAHAANTGRKVQVVVSTSEATKATDAGAGSSGPSSTSSPGREDSAHSLSILWEADPARAPGVFEPIPSLSADVADVSDLIEIRSVDRSSPAEPSRDPASTNLPDTDSPPSVAASQTASAGPDAVSDEPTRASGASAVTGREAASGAASGDATITFYPDGSCDGATLVLASRDADDARQVAVHLESVTGTTRRQWREASAETLETAVPTMESSPPQSRSSTVSDRSDRISPTARPKPRR